MAKVSEVTKARYRYRIVLDTGAAYDLSTAAYRERPVQPEDEVDPEEWERWVVLHQYRPALDKAVAMLAVRACSTGEIRQKLRRIGYAQSTVDMVLYKLEKHELLDDASFADQWAQYRSGQKYGPARIARELRQKGVSSEDAESALSALDEDEQLEAAKALAKKGFARSKPDEDPRKTAQRVLGSLVRRGYSWELARRACDAFYKEE